MGRISNGIDKVQVFELPAGVWVDGGIVAGQRVCLVRWRSEWTDKIHQVYVNGKFAGATVDGRQRQMVVQTPNCFDIAVRIEVFAIEPEETDSDFGDTLVQGEGGSSRVKLSLLRSQRLPAGARFRVYYDGGTGQIDYVNPIGEKAVWASRQDKAGLGLARFGEGDFGYEWSAGIGFGRGSFGAGDFGVDADVIEWISPALEAGAYMFAVKVIDEKGNESAASETNEVVVIPSARPAKETNLLSFDEETNELMLEIIDEQ
ncbi:MAG: hypothetical protein JW749_07515 [Sedimentisphaerales bacterium]|nr:hypothetical protein [Sedimentisphaerales bacterium]